MNAQELIQQFGYADSDAFLYSTDIDQFPEHAHIFRKAKDFCGLKGVYTLKNEGQSSIPLVYICEVADEKEADIIHCRVWNQDIVPFLLLVSPYHVRLYSGFEYDEINEEKRVLCIVSTINQALEELAAFKADAIDEGSLWKIKKWADSVRPKNRVDWKLLAELENLGQWLIDNGLNRHTANALVGKYVYLRYLKDRDILSSRRLAEWNISEQEIFGREANLVGFRAIDQQLQEWLKGDIFSIVSFDDITDQHISKVAGVFYGDEVSGQMRLFAAYDFSYIPLETLSVVYEQFLHAENRASDAGAYYTPVHLVNFILNEVEDRNPLQSSTKVLDPACGSGAFLVQAFRRMIEKKKASSEHGTLSPFELRSLLTEGIYGVDQDQDACQVAGLSLAMTLLDYIDPPDLWGCHKEFKLPNLQGVNIIHGDFFSKDIASIVDRHKFDWIVSNPPWNQTKQTDALGWIKNNKKRPVVSNQIAEAFAWKVLDHTQDNGVVGMLMPAMSLFYTSTVFRKAFFSQTDTWAIVNFANLVYVLFAGRSKVPAAAFFYKPAGEDGEEMITVFSPFRLTQPATRKKSNSETWSVTVNSTELRQVRQSEAARGHAVTWKLALWGSHRDGRLLESVAARFSTLNIFAQHHQLEIHQGIELRTSTDKEKTTAVPELIGKKQLLMTKLVKEMRYYTFPSEAFNTITKEEAYARKGRDKLPLQVSKPPHLIIGKSRFFAVYSNEFIAVPPRQIGIAGKRGQENLLKALAIYIVSDFSSYYEFFYASEIGIQKSISNLDTLNNLPVPLLSDDIIKKLAKNYDKLVDAEKILQKNMLKPIEQQNNEIINQALELSQEERLLVHDLVHERRKMLQGKVSQELLTPPSEKEMHIYSKVLQKQLNSFLGLGEEANAGGHAISVLYNDIAAMLEIQIKEQDVTDKLHIRKADKALSQEFNTLKRRLLKQHSQWLYFEQNLTIFDNERTYLFKPMERLHWLPSQALNDASNLIAQTMCAEII